MSDTLERLLRHPGAGLGEAGRHLCARAAAEAVRFASTNVRFGVGNLKRPGT
ncbi:hypothetical protein ACFPLB_12845 [Aquamicrobium segne]|uniref:Uncharacterized protein n=1 Tax=Aquamicrobium segne TaxID=469547 RepID=A0ABW0GZM3_9HYPH